MMNNREYLLNNYKHKITPGIKSVEELIDCLKGKVDIKEIATTEFSQPFFQHIIDNIIAHAVKDDGLNITTKQLNFVAYELIKNDKSNSYYQSDYVPILVQNCDNKIYIIFEKKTGYIYSNNNKIYLELYFERGISKYDYDNDSILFHAYLFRLDSFLKGDY